MNKNENIIVAQAIIFRQKNKSYEFLLLKRTPQEGGFWQSAGGKVEQGETVLDGAYREVLEESGINKEQILRVLEDIHFFSYATHYLTGEPILEVKEYVFAFEVKLEPEVSIDNNPCSEHESFGWFSFDKCIELMKWPENKKALIKLNELLLNESRKTH